jgi:hypothetical protein
MSWRLPFCALSALFLGLHMPLQLSAAGTLASRCQHLLKQIGELELVRLKNNRTFMANSLLKKMWFDHFSHTHENNLPYNFPPQLADYSVKFLEMQRDTFNEWHQGTGLVASVEWQALNIRGEVHNETLHPNQKTASVPFLKFRYNASTNQTPPSSYFGHNLKLALTQKSQIEVVYDPIRRLLIGGEFNALHIAGGSSMTPHTRILIADDDIFAIDTLPHYTMHELAHESVLSKENVSLGVSSNPITRNVFGVAKANKTSNVFASNYLNLAANNSRSSFMSIDEIYAYWISVKSSAFNLKQVLKRKNVTDNEVHGVIQNLRSSVKAHQDVSADAMFIFDEISTMLKNPGTTINIRRQNGKMSLVVNIAPQSSTSNYLKTPRSQIPEDLRLSVELPIELDPPKLWAIRFEEIIGGKNAGSGIYPLPANLRSAFQEHMNERINYLQGRIQSTATLGETMDSFLNKIPPPSREEIKAWSEGL